MILLIFVNHQPLSVLTNTYGLGVAGERQLPAGLRRRGCSCRCSSSTASTPPGRSARRRSTPAARRRAASCRRSSLSGIVGAIFLLAIILSTPDIAGEITAAGKGAFPIATTDPRTTSATCGATSTCSSILAAVFVCTMAIQGATTRLMFSMGRDRPPAGRRVWGQVSASFQTPANAAIAVGVLAAIPFLVVGQRRRSSPIARDRHDLRQLLPVQPRRADRPRRRAGRTRPPGSTSAAGASSSTSLALIYGGRDDHQHRALGYAGRSATGATGCATSRTRRSTRSRSSAATPLTSLPAMPIFEIVRGDHPDRRGDLLPRSPFGDGQTSSRPTWPPARRRSAEPVEPRSVTARRATRRAVTMSGTSMAEEAS